MRSLQMVVAKPMAATFYDTLFLINAKMKRLEELAPRNEMLVSPQRSMSENNRDF